MSVFLSALPGEALVRLRGNKIAQFLQGQFTCDLRRLTPTQTLTGAFCNAQGRVISDLRLIELDEEQTLILLRRSLCARFAQTLQRYAQFSRIAVDSEPPGFTIAGLLAEHSPAPETLGALAPLALGQALCADKVIAVRTGALQYVLIRQGDAAAPLAQTLNLATQAGEPENWQAETLRSGHYALELTDSERYTPQALNYDERGLLAFDKGCYTGQEVVARLHYKGKSKRRLQVYRCVGDAGEFVPGAAIRDIDGEFAGTGLRTEYARDKAVLLAAQVPADRRQRPIRLANGASLKPVLET